ncbi:glutamate mutase L [bacterium]|nr:glutamate mutase L [bacterium]
MIYCIDVGSTTTKLIGFDNSGSIIKSIILQDKHFTTVEAPNNDVTIAINELFKKNSIDCPKKNVYITSSAGGGLKILVIALTSSMSGNSAVRAAQISGGVIADKVTLDFPLTRIEKIEKIIQSSPDMMLFIGGIEGGGTANIIELAYILSYGTPRNYLTGEKIPLIYAGNSKAQKQIDRLLRKHYKIYFSENIRPKIMDENVYKVKDIIQDIFTNHVMKIAPGFKGIYNYTENNILPTPLAVEEFLLKRYKDTKETILAIDLGGATTDIFSNIDGNFKRTVVANLGMSYNIANIYTEKDSSFVNNFFGRSIDMAAFRNYIGNKYSNPTDNPRSVGEEQFEMILASLAIKKAMDIHFRDYYKSINVKKSLHSRKEVEKLREQKTYNAEYIDNIILSGGIFTILNREDTMKVIDSGLDTHKRIRIHKDNHFILPHLGNLLNNSDYDVNEIQRQHIEFCGYTTNQRKKFLFKNYDKNYLLIEDPKRDIKILKKNSSGLLFSKVNTDKFKDGDFINFAQYDKKNNNKSEVKEHSEKLFEIKRADNIIVEKFIPYPYKIRVKKNEIVNSESVIASCGRKINEIVVKNIFVKKDDRIEYLKKPGDNFNQEEAIFRLVNKKWGRDDPNFYFPYCGRIEEIDSENNIIILSRDIDNFRNDIVIDIDKKFRINKYNFPLIKGDAIYDGQCIFKDIYSPKSGIIKDIDLENQKITITAKYNNEDIQALVPGVVQEILGTNSVLIEVKGKVIYGKLGFGKEDIGIAVPYNSKISDDIRKKIIFFNSPCEFDGLKELIKTGERSFIFWNINYSTYKRLETENVNVIVLSGFSGGKSENSILNELSGKSIFINPYTSLRANVKRPYVIIGESAPS